jgi:DNA-binding MarR family transcriptional regulator
MSRGAKPQDPYPEPPGVRDLEIGVSILNIDNSRCNGYIVAMAQRLQDELKQTRPFPTLEEEVLVGLARTADALQRGFVGVFKTKGLSPTQYNVLRILRGAGGPGLSCGDIAERMITRDPDLTRLLDRLETRHLVTRVRDGEDRRVVTARITQAGLELLEELEVPLAAEQRRLLGHMAEKHLRALADLLDEARSIPD